MAELTFGEKLLIARKQLDLYQYEMAERLGVHANSLTKYERGEGKPHAAVCGSSRCCARRKASALMSMKQGKRAKERKQ